MTTLHAEPPFHRWQLLVDSAGIDRLAACHVAVFGVGGVGSFAAEALARSAVGRLTLVDFDVVAPSNVNRQLHALSDTVGQPKVELMADRCRRINPAATVTALQRVYDADSSAELLAGDYDLVLDCIDNITAKLHLIQRCKELGLPILASMGAANKVDPAQVHVGDLFHTHKCRLARIIRKELRRRGIRSGVRVVYSTEEYRPLRAAGEMSAWTEDGRRQRITLGSSAFIPPIFGLNLAAEAVRLLLGDTPHPEA